MVALAACRIAFIQIQRLPPNDPLYYSMRLPVQMFFFATFSTEQHELRSGYDYMVCKFQFRFLTNM